FGGKPLGGNFVAERVELRRRWPDEGDAGELARAREIGMLGKKAVAGMNGVGAMAVRHVDDRGNVQIGSDRLAAGRRTNRKRFVCLEPMEREAIFVAVDCDRLKAYLRCGAEATE